MLTDKLANLPRNERNRLYKQAASLRKLEKTRKPGRRAGEDDDAPTRRLSSLEDLVLTLIADEQAPESSEGAKTGTVVSVGPKTCSIRVDGEDVEVDLHGYQPAPGDVASYRAVEDRLRVCAIAPRTTTLSRHDAFLSHMERVVVANVDTVVIVVSVKAPPLHPRLIDRYLIAIQYGGADAILAVNKLDLAHGEERDRELAKIDPYRALGMPVVLLSTETGEGIAELEGLLAGKFAAFVGHSGVGKSSLLNAICPDLGIKTGSVMKGYGRGAHTTTTSRLHELPSGLRVIDTPGVRSFGLWDVGAQELQGYFPEFEGIRCRFSDCSHLHEPGCGVRQAVAEGRVHPARYDTFRRLAEG